TLSYTLSLHDALPIFNTAPGVYDFSGLDAKLAEAKAAGFQYLSVAVTDSSSQTPQWLLDSLPPDQKIALIDPASSHTTFCQPIRSEEHTSELQSRGHL